MRVVVGDPSIDAFVATVDDIDPESHFEDRALRRLFRGEDLVVPWFVGLLVLEIFDSEEERAAALGALAPAWLTDADQDALLGVMLAAGLPARTSLRVEVKARGTPGRTGYALVPRWTDGEGTRVSPNVVGGLVDEGDAKRRVTVGQYRLLNAIEDAGELGGDRARDLLSTQRFRSCVPAGDPGVVFDAYLRRESAMAVEKVAPRLAKVREGYQVRPSVKGLPQKVIEDSYYGAPSRWGHETLSVRGEGGQRTRVVLEPSAVEGMKKCRELDVLTAEQAAHAISHPEEVFGDALDLSELSDRVFGLGPAIHVAHPILSEREAKDWWDWDLSAELEDGSEDGEAPAPLDLKDQATRVAVTEAIQRADEAGDAVIPHPSGDGFVAVTPRLREAIQTAESLAQAEKKAGGRLRSRPRDVLLVKENLETLEFEREERERTSPFGSVGRPPALRPGYELKAHQQQGLDWLVSLLGQRGDERSWGGCLLADDMGLGKTLQVLSFLSWAKSEQGRAGPHLVVAPVALLDNWKAEAGRFFGDALEPILLATGRVLPNVAKEAARLLGQQNIVLTSYETLRRQEITFSQVRWDVMIMDEAQKAKTPGSSIHRVVRAMNASYRLAMTGTPVENTLAELWSVYDWARPGMLGSLREFSTRYIKPIRAGADEVKAELANQLNGEIQHLYLRRMKQDVVTDLPPLSRDARAAPLSAEQEVAYARVASGDRRSIGTLISLFGVCAHPGLLSQGALARTSMTRFPKVERLLDILDEVHARGEKALIFANRVRVQHWLADEIAERYGVHVDVINGSVTGSRARMALIERFEETKGFGVLVLAPRAAGVGLNITCANHVVHYTREWNPALENQATDRAYRIGQERPVTVYTITTTSDRGRTVEERLAELLAEKRSLMTSFIVPTEDFNIEAEDFEDEVQEQDEDESRDDECEDEQV